MTPMIANQINQAPRSGNGNGHWLLQRLLLCFTWEPPSNHCCGHFGALCKLTKHVLTLKSNLSCGLKNKASHRRGFGVPWLHQDVDHREGKGGRLARAGDCPDADVHAIHDRTNDLRLHWCRMQIPHLVHSCHKRAVQLHEPPFNMLRQRCIFFLLTVRITLTFLCFLQFVQFLKSLIVLILLLFHFFVLIVIVLVHVVYGICV
mmetsp:Transcript_280/g.489  ORF Transcript_280/g.489 Transcript_280/m.489 type:complete len:204 (+) Transcript_280:95-706(+)